MYLLHLPLRSIAILLAMLWFFTPSVDARPVSVEEAIAKAQRFYANAKDPILRSRGISATEFKLAYEAKTAAKTASCFYVLNQSPSKGFIIISADDRLPEVLGYSDSGNFDINQIPDNMKWWLSEYERQIEQVLSSSNVDNISSTEHREGWTPIEPLVKTKWNQHAPYNNLCPTIDGQRCVTGCVATAMAQIMNYHQWPATGRGSHSYGWNGQTLSMDFSTVTFDWENMQNTYSGTIDSEEAQNAVATLMLACGISVNMRYGVSSYAYHYRVYDALYYYFDYDADYLERNDVELSYWESLIYNELVNKRPVYYAGSSGTSGHAFVCDGYSNDGMFHINWGWGYGGGYYLLNILDGWTNDQEIIYGISPIKYDEIQNGIIINAENFPDDNFRSYLLEQEYAKEGVLKAGEVKRMRNIIVSQRKISNLKGIEYFTGLTLLLCSDNRLTSLDVSNNTALTDLWCYRNQLTSLDVSKNTALTGLLCSDNQLTSLDVSQNTALNTLWCQNNQLTALDISGCTALTDLDCSNNKLTFLNCSRSNFKGEAMDNIINNLPQNTTNEICKFYVYDDSYSDEGNICTKEQVAIVKSKGWTPYYFDATDKVWKEYEGEELEDIIARKKAKAETVYKTAISVYEQYMSYYEGDGMAYYKQVAEVHDSNNAKIKGLFDDIEMLEKKISESGMTEEEKTSYLTTLNEIKVGISVLDMENDSILSSNSFYAYVKEYYEKYISAYNDRLILYNERIESATIIEELNTIIEEIGTDAENIKVSYLEHVIINYEDLKQIEPELIEIGDKLEKLEVQFLSFSDEVNAAIFEILFSERKAEAIAAYQIATNIYDKYLFYYEGEGMAYYQQVTSKQTNNHVKAEEIISDVKELENKITESSLTNETKDSYFAILSDLKENILTLGTENDNILASNQFYDKVYEHFESISKYNGRLIQYNERIESATTIEELNTLIEEIEQDTEETEILYLNPVVNEYESLEQIDQRLVQIGEELEGLEVQFLSLSDEVNDTITGITNILNTDIENIIVYTIDGKRQVMKKEDMKLLPKSVYIVNGKKYVVK